MPKPPSKPAPGPQGLFSNTDRITAEQLKGQFRKGPRSAFSGGKEFDETARIGFMEDFKKHGGITGSGGITKESFNIALGKMNKARQNAPNETVKKDLENRINYFKKMGEGFKK
ncbi:MAG: hypothetical protein Q8P63_01805 [Candidatus Nealsonbacteria bacterium]|nr:hypothetical protein [Candidatus Nealsonbacteria bacterium]